jgi:hypothetical protein
MRNYCFIHFTVRKGTSLLVDKLQVGINALGELACLTVNKPSARGVIRRRRPSFAYPFHSCQRTILNDQVFALPWKSKIGLSATLDRLSSQKKKDTRSCTYRALVRLTSRFPENVQRLASISDHIRPLANRRHQSHSELIPQPYLELSSARFRFVLQILMAVWKEKPQKRHTASDERGECPHDTIWAPHQKLKVTIFCSTNLPETTHLPAKALARF